MQTFHKRSDTVLLVLNYKKYIDTINFLKSVIESEINDADLIILDNNSQNDSIEKIRDWAEVNYPGYNEQESVLEDYKLDDNRFSESVELVYSKSQLKLFKSNTNFGFSGGNNALGIIGKELGYRYFFFLNSDIEFCDKFTIRKLKNCFQEFPNAYLSGPCVINKNDTFDSPFKADTYWGDLIYYPFVNSIRRWFDLPIIQFDTNALSKSLGAEVYKISGAALFFPAEKFFQIGMFDENVWLSCEEAILAEKILQRGGKTIYLPTTVMLHIKASAPRLKNRRADILANHFKQRNYFYRTYKHYGPVKLMCLKVAQQLRIFLAHF